MIAWQAHKIVHSKTFPARWWRWCRCRCWVQKIITNYRACDTSLEAKCAQSAEVAVSNTWDCGICLPLDNNLPAVNDTKMRWPRSKTKGNWKTEKEKSSKIGLIDFSLQINRHSDNSGNSCTILLEKDATGGVRASDKGDACYLNRINLFQILAMPSVIWWSTVILATETTKQNKRTGNDDINARIYRREPSDI